MDQDTTTKNYLEPSERLAVAASIAVAIDKEMKACLGTTYSGDTIRREREAIMRLLIQTLLPPDAPMKNRAEAQEQQ